MSLRFRSQLILVGSGLYYFKTETEIEPNCEDGQELLTGA
jgi:hypothetical protein